MSNLLNTKVLPKYNCSNCKHFVITTVGNYSIECCNVVHPLLDCVLRGFEAHSDQPTFRQTINK